MEIDIRRTKTCQKCKNVVSLDKVRLFPKDKDTNILVCDACCEELKQRGKDKEPVQNSKANSVPTITYTTYTCTRCNYSFRADKNKAGVIHNLMCPYCGKPDRLEKPKA